MGTFGPRVFKEGGGLVQQFGTLALVNRAPHPNAAKVFINWLLSRRGQMALQKARPTQRVPPDSLRIDIPKDEVPFEPAPPCRISNISTLANLSGWI